MNKQQRIDKQTFKQIFGDHFAELQNNYPRCKHEDIKEVVHKMLDCAEKNGYATYKCMKCAEKNNSLYL